MSSLETSVTLEDVFSVVEGKRVPLAPELAGYLTLEVADGADAGGGAIDPKSVFISEEGTVALVKKKDAAAGDAEASVRGILQKLLEASGSSTPALTAAAKRKPVAGLPALVEELEAALIPVNRAAGRRALARLAREVKRVTMGVGRNALGAPIGLSVPPAAPKKESAAPAKPLAPRAPARSEDDARPAAAPADIVARARKFDDEPMTTKRPPLSDVLESEKKMRPGLPVPPRGAGAPLPPPPQRGSGPPMVAPPPRRDAPGSAPPAPAVTEVRPEGGGEKLFGGSEVDDLLSAFEVTGSEKQHARDLKAIAGLSPTPPPADAKRVAELSKDVGKEPPKKRNAEANDSVEALLALADAASKPTAPPTRPLPPRAEQGSFELSAPLAQRPAPPAAPPPVAPLPPAPPPPAPFALAAPLLPAPTTSASSEPPFVSSAAEPPKRPSPPKIKAAPPVASAPPVSSQRRKTSEAPLAKQTGRKTKTGRTGQHKRPRPSRAGLFLLVFVLVALTSATIGIYLYNPAFFTGRRKLPVKPTPSSSTTVPLPAPRCKVALVVTDAPNNAEILLRVGQSPVDVDRMPVGTRLEFVATAEGYAPRRAIIRAESPWDRPDGKYRIDLPVQLDPSKAKPGQNDPWPAAEPGSQVGGSGQPGTVHVVANVRGAEIWLLAGLGPEARIEQLRCDADIDVLLAGAGSLRKRLHINERDISAAMPDANGNKVVTTSAK
jgi:hypothetical protein